MRHPSPLAACAAAALLAFVGTAHATATATATISVVSWTLTDLNLTDGITPAITFSSPYSQSFVNLVATPNGISQFVPGAYQVTTASGSNIYGSAAANTSATGGQATATLKGSTAAGTSVQEYAYAYPFSASFTLTPNTLVSFTASYTASASTTLGYVNGNSEYGQAYAYLSASLSGANGSQANYSAGRGVFASSTYNPTTQTYSGATASESGTVELLIANRQSSPTTGSFNAYSYAYDSSSLPAPVPENNTLSLMSLGLVGLVVSLRRLRRV